MFDDLGSVATVTGEKNRSRKRCPQFPAAAVERWRLWENNGPTKDEEGQKEMRQWWALGRTKDGLKVDPGGAPASSAPFSELAGEPEARSWAEIDPTEVLARRRGRRIFLVRSATVSCRNYFQRNVVVHGAGGRGFEPTQVNAEQKRCMVCASVVDGGGW